MIKVTKAFICSLLLFIGFISNTYAGSIDPELVNQLANQKSSGHIDIIIELSNIQNQPTAASATRQGIITSLQDIAKANQNEILSLLKISGIPSKSIWINNSVATSVPASLVQQIADISTVSIVKLDKKIVLEADIQGAAPSQADWNITSIGADTVWSNGTTGVGIVIGSMDSGVDIDHPDLSISWRGGTNSWYDPYGVYTAPHDADGHGTQTTSLIVGGSAGGNTVGVAPGATWIAAKIFDDTNTSSISNIHLSFQWMLDPDGDPNTNDSPNIINNSWNFDTSNSCDNEFQGDISLLRGLGIAVVFSSGNSGPNLLSSHSPANNSGTVPVGAIDESLNIAFSSSRGPSACNSQDIYPKLTAPGINVRTADLTFGGTIPNSYTFSSGTSFAAPHISGALALIQSKYPLSTLDDRETALFNTAVATGSPNDFGHGIVDVNAAINYMSPIVQPISPLGNIGANTTPTYTWNSVTGTTWYKLWVNDSTGNIINQWYTADLAGCANGETTCSVTPTTVLADGNAIWWIQAYNALGNGPWSTGQDFFIGGSPAAATLLSPSGNITINNPVYTWEAVSGATWYYLWVDDPSGNIIKQWYTADLASCGNGETTCSVTPAATLTQGAGQWWIKTYNSAGSGPWSVVMPFTFQ